MKKKAIWLIALLCMGAVLSFLAEIPFNRATFSTSYAEWDRSSERGKPAFSHPIILI